MDVRLFILFASFVGIFSEKQSYSGFHLIKVLGHRLEDFQFLQHVENPGQLVLWDYERGSGDFPVALKFHVHPDLVDFTMEAIEERGLRYEILSYDMQEEIDREWEENMKARAKDDEWFESYHTYDEIMAWLDDHTAECGSGCSTFSIGNSYEGRELKVVKVTGAPNSCDQKPQIWIDSGIHSREWIAHTTGMYLFDMLIHEYQNDSVATAMRDNYDWYFLVCVNPDGYAYTWESDRLWRKTRQPVDGSLCVGTDCNRNFDFMWMTIGASSNPCSDTFAGPEPYSEPEARAVNDYVLTMNGTFTLFITLHTYGQLWMSPWGYTADLPVDHDETMRVSRAAVQTILETHGEVYQAGNAGDILYFSSGTSRDWAKGVPWIPYVYTIELRNTNSFVLPPSEIRPTGEEIWAALKTTIQRIEDVRPPDCVSIYHNPDYKK